MDKKIRLNKFGAKLLSFKLKQPFLFFGLYFIIIFTILFFILSPFIEIHSGLNSSAAESFVKKYVNNKFGSGKQSKFEYYPENYKLVLYTVYYNKKNPDGTLIQKAITINMFMESFIPVIFFIALFIATNLTSKEKIIRMTVGLLILELYIIFKICALFFDNYSYPDFELIHLDGLLGGIIYYYNKLIKSAGTSINFMIVALLWVFTSGMATRLLDEKKES